MNYLEFLLPIPFVISTVIFIILFINKNKENKENENTIKEHENSIEELSNVDILREGYFKEDVNFAATVDSKKFDTYNCIVYIKELDRYTNGKSKIQIKNVEVIKGFDSNSYQTAKDRINGRFCSVKDTKDIEWLESEEHLKTKRKEKLKKIINNINKP